MCVGWLKSTFVSSRISVQEDFYGLLKEIDKLFKNINEKLNLWIHFKKNSVSHMVNILYVYNTDILPLKVLVMAFDFWLKVDKVETPI